MRGEGGVPDCSSQSIDDILVRTRNVDIINEWPSPIAVLVFECWSYSHSGESRNSTIGRWRDGVVCRGGGTARGYRRASI